MDDDKLDALLEDRLRRELTKESSLLKEPTAEQMAAYRAALHEQQPKPAVAGDSWWSRLFPTGWRWPVLAGGLATAAAFLLVFLLTPVGSSSGSMLKGEIRGAPEPQFLREIGSPVSVTLVPGKQSFQVPLAPGRMLVVACTVTSVADSVIVATATASGQLADGRSVTGTGTARIRTTKPSRDISGVHFRDLSWVLLELHLSAGTESGDLTLTFGSP